MSSIDLALFLASFVMCFCAAAWAYVRLRDADVKGAKIKFGQDQLQFARQQHTDHMELRSGQLRHLSSQGGSAVLPFPTGPKNRGGGGGTVQ